MNIYRSHPALALSAARSRKPAAPGLTQQFSAQVLNRMAASAATHQQFEQALAVLDELVARFPQEAKYYCNRGLIYLQSGRAARALQDFNQAIRLSHRLDQAYNNRASCYAALGNAEAAIADYTQAIDLNPFNTKARINLGITLRELEQFDEALVVLEEALLFHRLTGQIYAQLGRTYHLRGDWNVAIASYKNALDNLRSDGSRSDQRLREQTMNWLQQLSPS